MYSTELEVKEIHPTNMYHYTPRGNTFVAQLGRGERVQMTAETFEQPLPSDACIVATR